MMKSTSPIVIATTTPFLALLATTLTLLAEVSTSSSAAPSSSGELTSCFLYPTRLTDLGWTFQMNQARTLAGTAVTQRYPNVTIHSRYVEDFAVKYTLTQREDLIRNSLAKPATDGGWGCNIILFLSEEEDYFLSTETVTDLASDFPGVQWYHYSSTTAAVASSPSNLHFVGVDIWAGWFLAGAVAGGHLSSSSSPSGSGGKICMFYPSERGNSGINAFYRGLQFSSSSSASLYVVQTHAFSEGEAELEKQVATEFAERSCQIIVRWAASAESDLHVANLSSAATSTPQIFSIGYGADSSQFVGNSVLTSVVLSMNSIFEGIYEGYINSTLANPQLTSNYPEGIQGLDVGALSLADISTTSNSVSNNAKLVLERAKAWILVNRSTLFCDDEYKRLANGSLSLEGDSSGCLNNDILMRNTWSLHSNINTFASPFQAITTCVAGEYALYDEATLALSCPPCPANSFTEKPGQENCTSCPAGQEAAERSAMCTVVQEKTSVSASTIALVVVLTVIVLILIIVVLGGGCSGEKNQKGNNKDLVDLQKGSSPRGGKRGRMSEATMMTGESSTQDSTTIELDDAPMSIERKADRGGDQEGERETENYKEIIKILQDEVDSLRRRILNEGRTTIQPQQQQQDFVSSRGSSNATTNNPLSFVQTIQSEDCDSVI